MLNFGWLPNARSISVDWTVYWSYRSAQMSESRAEFRALCFLPPDRDSQTIEKSEKTNNKLVSWLSIMKVIPRSRCRHRDGHFCRGMKEIYSNPHPFKLHNHRPHTSPIIIIISVLHQTASSSPTIAGHALWLDSWCRLVVLKPGDGASWKQ